jgi:hypothetical protein
MLCWKKAAHDRLIDNPHTGLAAAAADKKRKQLAGMYCSDL